MFLVLEFIPERNNPREKEQCISVKDNFVGKVLEKEALLWDSENIEETISVKS